MLAVYVGIFHLVLWCCWFGSRKASCLLKPARWGSVKENQR